MAEVEDIEDITSAESEWDSLFSGVTDLSESSLDSEWDSLFTAPSQQVVEPSEASFIGRMGTQLVGGTAEFFMRSDTMAILDSAEAFKAHTKGEDYYSKNPIGSISNMWRDFRGKRDPSINIRNMQRKIDSRTKNMERAEASPFSPATLKFMDENSDKSIWEDFSEAPFDIIAELTVRSLPNMVPGLIYGSAAALVAGPWGFAAGMGLGSARVEYAASMMEGLEEAGVDLQNAESIIAAVHDEELMARIHTRALIRAGVIGGFDGIAGKLAGKTLTPFKNKMVRELTNAVAQAGAQGFLGAGGEAAAQYAVGDEFAPREIIAEGLGELGTSPIDVTAAAISGARGEKVVIDPRRDPNVRATRDMVPGDLDPATVFDEFDSTVKEGDPELEVSADELPGAGGVTPQQISAWHDVQQANLQAEMDAETTPESDVGDALDQTLENQEASKASEALDVEIAAENRRIEATAEGRVMLAEEELVAEQAEKAERGEAVNRAIKRMAAAGIPIEPDTELDAAILAAVEQQAQETATEEAKVAEAEELRETTQKAVEERLGAEQEQPGDESATELARQQEQQEAAQRYVVRTELADRPTAERAGEEAEAEVGAAAELRARRPTLRSRSVSADKQPISPAMRDALEKAAGAEDVEVTLETLVDQEAHEAADSPLNELPESTPAQQEADNYKKGHFYSNGIQYSVETPEGGVRHSKPGAVTTWSRVMKGVHYLGIPGTRGADGDNVDAFAKSGADLGGTVYVIDQVDQETGNFDEHKVMLGFKSSTEARRAYLQQYTSGWKAGLITSMTIPEYKLWLKSDTTVPTNAKTPVATVENVEAVTPQRGMRFSTYQDPAFRVAYKMSSEQATTQEEKNKVLDIGEAVGLGKMTVEEGITELRKLSRGEPESTESGNMLARRAEGAPGQVDVRTEVARILKLLPNIKAIVVNSVNDLPENLAKGARGKIGVRGIYDIETDQVYIIADAHSSVEDIERTMLHEGVAHKGLRYIMGDVELASLLDSVYELADSTVIADIETKYGLDNTDQEQRREAAEEYLAQLAEQGDNSTIFQKAVAAVRSALRKAGLAKTWTDNDIRGLLREATRKMEGIPAQRVTLSMEAEVEGTGEVVTIDRKADVVIRQIDKRVDVIERLRTCLG